MELETVCVSQEMNGPDLLAKLPVVVPLKSVQVLLWQDLCQYWWLPKTDFVVIVELVAPLDAFGNSHVAPPTSSE